MRDRLTASVHESTSGHRSLYWRQKVSVRPPRLVTQAIQERFEPAIEKLILGIPSSALQLEGGLLVDGR